MSNETVMKVPLPRLRNRLILLLFLLAFFYGVRVGMTANSDSMAAMFAYLIGAALTSSISTIDSAERGRPLPHALKMLLALGWGIAGPIYAVFGRGLRRAGWGLALVFSIAITYYASAILGFAQITREVPLQAMERSEMMDLTGNMVFPGFGRSSFATRQADGTLFFTRVIEVPLQGKNRNLVFHAVDEKYSLVDDFFWPDSSPKIRRVVLDGGTVRCFDFGGNQLRETRSLQAPGGH